MRPCSTQAEAAGYASEQRPVWLLELHGSGWNWHGATRAIEYEGHAWPGRLAGIERWEESLPEDAPMPGGIARSRATVRVADLPGATDSLRDRLAVMPPGSIEARLDLLWLGADAPAPGDAMLVLDGRLAAWRAEGAGVALEIGDVLDALGGRSFGRVLTDTMVGLADSESIGQGLPWVFGRVERSALLPLYTGRATRLASAIDAVQGVIAVDSVEGFPASGKVQVDGEQIDYPAVDSVAGTLGTLGQPVTRGGSAAAHPRGAVVRLRPTGGFYFAVADHACHAVEALFADGLEIDSAAWTPLTTVLDGQAVQLVNMLQWPVNEDGRMARRIEVTAEGLEDSGGNLIDNPVRIIERLLTDARLGGLDPARLDAAAFDAQAAVHAARGDRFTRRIDGRTELAGLLDQAAREAGVWLRAGGLVRPARIDPGPDPGDALERFDWARLLARRREARVSLARGAQPPERIKLIGAQRVDDPGREVLGWPASALADATREWAMRVRWLDLSVADSAQSLAERVWHRLADAAFEVRMMLPPGALALEPGDVIEVDDRGPDLVAAPAWVRRIERDEGAWVHVLARGPWAGPWMWRGDALNDLRRHAFGGDLTCRLEGQPVLRLSREGNLALRGRLSENMTLAEGLQAEPIAQVGTALILSHGAGPYTPFMRISSGGDVELVGSLREGSTRSIDLTQGSWGSSSGRFWLSNDGSLGTMEFDAAAEVLHLPGRLTELANL